MNDDDAARIETLIADLDLEAKVAQLSCAGRANEMDDLFDADGALDVEEFARRHPAGTGQIGRMALDRDPAIARRNTRAIQQVLRDQAPQSIGALFNEEGIHGLMARGATVFPAALALASTWDVALVERTAIATALEARHRGSNYVYGPVLDVGRDPRWGRVEETFGEDPFLIGRMGVATVAGLQGRTGYHIDHDHVLACAKHFVAHGIPQSGANAGPVDIGERTLREVHLAPFIDVIDETDVGAIMAAYHAVDGVPVHVDERLLDELLRGELGFAGMVTSDGFGIPQLASLHRVATDPVDAARQAFEAGIDCEVPQPVGTSGFAALVRSGALDESVVDRALRRVLRAKDRLGLLDPDSAAVSIPPPAVDHDELSFDAARRAVVLLTNNGVLPLLPTNAAHPADAVRHIVVTGPNAEHAHLGGYTDPGATGVSVLDGLRTRYGPTAVTFHEGCRLTTQPSGPATWWQDDVAMADPTEDDRRIAEAVEAARGADVVIAVVGGNEATHREGWWFDHLGDRSILTMPGRQDELLERIAATGTLLIAVVISAGPVDLRRAVAVADAIVWTCYPGQRGGDAIAAVLAGDHDPGGRLPVSFPASTGQIPITADRLPSAGRNYLNEPNEPLFAFGHGLSYARFDVRFDGLDRSEIPVGELRTGATLTVVATVTNVGERPGIEHVRLTVDDRLGTVSRPRHRLIDFAVVELQPGAAIPIELTVTQASLALLDRDMQRVVEPGTFGLSLHWTGSHPPTAPSRPARADAELRVL